MKKDLLEINERLLVYRKLYEKSGDLEIFRINIANVLSDMQKTIPVSPVFSWSLFQLQLDCENLKTSTVGSIVRSIEQLLQSQK